MVLNEFLEQMRSIILLLQTTAGPPLGFKLLCQNRKEQDGFTHYMLDKTHVFGRIKCFGLRGVQLGLVAKSLFQRGSLVILNFFPRNVDSCYLDHRNVCFRTKLRSRPPSSILAWFCDQQSLPRTAETTV